MDLKKSKDYLLGRFPSNYPILLVQVDFILVNTCDGDEQNLKDTPHYKYLLGQKDQYRNYILKHLGKTIKDDHLPEKYDMLIKNFKYGLKIDNIPQYIIVKPTKNPNKYVVVDGVHRLAILKKNDQNLINVYLENF